MTNISKRTVDHKEYTLAYNELIQFIGKLTTKRAVFLIDELLTDTERIMIVKRYAAIMMLHKKFSYYRVSQTLTLSTSTTRQLYKNYTEGAYDNLIDGLAKKDTSRFMALLEDLIMAQVSPKARARLLNRVL
jgi:uncharacterized protein YerC